MRRKYLFRLTFRIAAALAALLLRLLRLCGAAKVLLAGADGYRPGTAAYADEGLHTHTGRGAAYNAQMAGAIRAAGLPVEFITPSEYERA